MKSGLQSLILLDDHVRKKTRPCPFCTRKYDWRSGFFGLCPFKSINTIRVRAVDRHCRKMRQKNKCGARFFHLAKVRGDNFLSRNLIQLTDFRQQ